MLPLLTGVHSIALVGPLADNQAELLGPWAGQGRPRTWCRCSTASPPPRQAPPSTTRPAARSRTRRTRTRRSSAKSGFADAVAAANASDVIVAVVGEAAGQSGEAAARSDIGLPGQELALIKRSRRRASRWWSC